MAYVIEKNVPLPRGRSESFAAAVRAMQVGDSMVVPLKVRNGLGTYAVRFQMKFATRTQPDGTCRIWRTA